VEVSVFFCLLISTRDLPKLEFSASFIGFWLNRVERAICSEDILGICALCSFMGSYPMEVTFLVSFCNLLRILWSDPSDEIVI